MIPNKLYHATYRQFLDSIKINGLGNTKQKMWPDSEPGIVYLASDPWIAESYAEEAEWIYQQNDPDAYLDSIVILEIDTAKLDTGKIKVDRNVLLDDDEENATWEYHSIIPWAACKIFKPTNKRLIEYLGNYEIVKEGKCLAAYKDGELITRSQNYTELAADLNEYEEEQATKSKFKVTWIIEANTVSGYELKSEEVAAFSEQEAKNYIENKYPNARDIKVIKLESVLTNFASDFKLYENLWEQL